MRCAIEDVEIAGVTIPAGTLVIANTGMSPAVSDPCGLRQFGELIDLAMTRPAERRGSSRGVWRPQPADARPMRAGYFASSSCRLASVRTSRRANRYANTCPS
jgi:hypothetical protein